MRRCKGTLLLDPGATRSVEMIGVRMPKFQKHCGWSRSPFAWRCWCYDIQWIPSVPWAAQVNHLRSPHMPYCHASVLLGGAWRYVLDLSWSFNSIVFGEDRHSCAGLNDKMSREVHTGTQQVASPPKQGRDFPTTLAIPILSPFTFWWSVHQIRSIYHDSFISISFRPEDKSDQPNNVGTPSSSWLNKPDIIPVVDRM